MKRKCMNFLIKWLSSPHRKPLIIRGARQVGKTWLVRELAKLQNRELIEINLELDRSLKSLFNTNYPEKIIKNIEAKFQLTIEPEKSILFIDEIQAAPKIIAKLRWFAERMPELPVLTAGSLLEFVLDKPSFSVPVGRIGYLYVEPLSFEEYLLAVEKDQLLNYLESFTWETAIPETIHVELMNLFKEYVIIGGMPEAVSRWIESDSLDEVSSVHQNLVSNFESDFNHYSDTSVSQNLIDVFATIPENLGKKFVYRSVSKEIDIDLIKKALELLCLARICHKVRAVAANGLPLGSEVLHKFSKIILLDVGLCSAALSLSLERLIEIPELILINSGGIAEQVTGQLLRTLFPFYQKPGLYYWIRPKTGASAEIDYVIQHGMEVVPIEVKAGTSGALKSLHLFMEEKQLTKAVRIYSGPPLLTDISVKTSRGKAVAYQLRSLPFYLIGELTRLLE